MEDRWSVLTVVREGVQIVVVLGDLDEMLAEEVDDAIERRGDDWPVVIDLSGVDFVSSTGLEVLLRDRRAQTALVCPSGNVARLFEVVRTNRRVSIFKDMDSAIQSVTLGRSAEPHAAPRSPSHEGTRNFVHACDATQPSAYV